MSHRDLVAEADWRKELDGWLGPFLEELGHAKRRRWAPVYLRGLIGLGDCKSLQPMAARLGLSGHDQLQHFLASTAWDDAPLRRLLVERADALVGGSDAVLVIDDTALPKQGRHSVGVARQYCGCLGKRANCQVLVSLTLARGEVPVPIGLRLFLPEGWTADTERCARAGVPEEHRRALAKTDIALAEIDRVMAAGARFGRGWTRQLVHLVRHPAGSPGRAGMDPHPCHNAGTSARLSRACGDGPRINDYWAKLG